VTALFQDENKANLGGNHEESEESVGEKHLHLLVVGGQVALRVVRFICVRATPLKS
jgi:hypothetical protein